RRTLGAGEQLDQHGAVAPVLALARRVRRERQGVLAVLLVGGALQRFERGGHLRILLLPLGLERRGQRSQGPELRFGIRAGAALVQHLAGRQLRNRRVGLGAGERFGGAQGDRLLPAWAIVRGGPGDE